MGWKDYAESTGSTPGLTEIYIKLFTGSRTRSPWTGSARFINRKLGAKCAFNENRSGIVVFLGHVI